MCKNPSNVDTELSDDLKTEEAMLSEDAEPLSDHMTSGKNQQPHRGVVFHF